MRNLRIALTLLALLLPASNASASLIQWEFTGAYSGGWPIPIGSPVTLDWTFETTLADLSPFDNSAIWQLTQPVYLTMGGWRYTAAGTLESAFRTDGFPSGENEVLLRLFWGLLGSPPVQLDPTAPGPLSPPLSTNALFNASYLLLPDASVLGGMPPAGGSLVSTTPYPAQLILRSDGIFTGANISGEVIATPEPSSLLLLGTGCAALLARRRKRR